MSVMDQTPDVTLSVIGAMREAGLTVPELAERIGLSEQQLRDRLSGRPEFRVSEIWRISRIVGRKWFDLMDTDTAA